MRKISFCVLAFASVLLAGLGLMSTPVTAVAQGVANLSNEQATGGLKEALTRSVGTAVSETGRPGGYEKNALIKIVFPEKLKFAEKGLRAAGMGPQVDKFEHSMNAAAEQAAPAAKSIFLKALQSMTFDDARRIVTGGDTAGTDYFKRTTSTQVSEAFRPIIKKAMATNGVTEKYNALMQSAPKTPFGGSGSLDIDDYVLGKAVDGLFTMMGEEEKKIRTNPAAQVTPLLKTVFGKR